MALSGSAFGAWWLWSSSGHRAGVSVSELNALSSVLTAMVMANCWKNWPVMPGMNALGTNTAASTSEIPRMALPTSDIAARVASRGSIPFARFASTASTTTIASSTTMPMASTMPNRVSVLSENPTASITASVPTSATGTASIGISAARQFWRNTMTTMNTRTNASTSVWTTASIDSCTNPVVSKAIVYSIPSGNRSFFNSSIRFLTRSAVWRAFAPGSVYTARPTAGSRSRNEDES